MTWASLIPAVVACAALLFIPGGAMAYAMGLRGIPAMAAAPVITVTVTSLTAIAVAKAGIGWSVWPAAAVAIIAAVVLWLAGRTVAKRVPVQRPRPAAPMSRILPAVGFMAGAGTIAWQLVRLLGAPESFSQTLDNIFHLNVVHYIISTGDASSLTVSSMTNGDDPPYFYPAAWHGLVALVVQMTQTPLPTAVNAVNLVVAAGVWTLGCMFLVRTVAGPKPLVVGFAGVLAASFSAFPILLLDFGVLYPNFLSIALLPSGLAAAAAFFNAGSRPIASPFARFALPLVLVPGIALAHPNGIMTLLALTVPVVLYAFWKRYISGGRFSTQRGESLLATAALAASLALLAVLWKVVRPPADAAFWGPYHSPAGAAWEVVTNSAMSRPEAWVVSALMLIGLYISVRNAGHWWLVGCFAVTSILFVVVAGFPTSDWRSLLTGVWYNDSYRLAAILPLTALPLAALGSGWLCEKIRDAATVAARRDAGVLGRLAGSPAARAAAGVLGVVLVAVGMQVPAMDFAVATASRSYAETPRAEVVSTDELALIDKLDGLVPPGEAIAVNPWTGGALAYALAGRQTTSKHVLSTYTPAVATINAGLRDAASDPAVCAAVRSANVGYALDFGTLEVHGGHHDFPGLDDLQDSPAAELVAQVGQAKLFRITACR